MEDTLTVLRTTNPRNLATKRLSRKVDGGWLKDGKAKLGSSFLHEAQRVSDIDSLYEAVQRLSRDPRAFVIRGQLKTGVDKSAPVYRRCQDHHGETAHFEEVSRQWLMLDFDKVPVGEVDLFDDPESAVEKVIYTHLPAMCRDVSCIWQLSSGAGTADPDGVLSLHIWFWLDRPMSNSELTLFYANHAPSVDLSLFRTVQPHYVAKPIFIAPAVDPLPRRVGLMRREFDALTLPYVDTIERSYRGYSGPSTGLTGSVRGVDAKLARMGDGPGLLGFNAVIPAAIAAYICHRFPYEIDADAIKARVRRAIASAPIAATRDKGSLNRYASDPYLDECIRTATQNFAMKPVVPLFPKPSITPSEARAALAGCIVDAIGYEISRLAA
jgi:hypothetical protein